MHQGTLEPESAAQVIGRFQAKSWEMLYPTLRTVMKKEPTLQRECLSDFALSAEVVRFVEERIFVTGRPWLLLVYYREHRLSDRLELAVSTLAMLRQRLSTTRGWLNKLKLAAFVVFSMPRAIRVNYSTQLSSVSNHMYNLTLEAHAHGWGSCIQFSYALVEASLKRTLHLHSGDRIVGAVVLGVPP